MVGCGSDENDAGTAGPDTVATTLETTAESTAAPTSRRARTRRLAPADRRHRRLSVRTTSLSGVIEIEAVDYAFENLPDNVPAGTRLTLANTANAELHELVAIRLPDDETRAVEELMQLPEAELGAIIGAGPPTAVLLAAPGGEQIAAVGDGTLSEPGRYLVFCSIPSGVAPEAYISRRRRRPAGNSPRSVADRPTSSTA